MSEIFLNRNPELLQLVTQATIKDLRTEITNKLTEEVTHLSKDDQRVKSEEFFVRHNRKDLRLHIVQSMEVPSLHHPLEKITIFDARLDKKNRIYYFELDPENLTNIRLERYSSLNTIYPPVSPNEDDLSDKDILLAVDDKYESFELEQRELERNLGAPIVAEWEARELLELIKQSKRSKSRSVREFIKRNLIPRF